MNKRKPDDEFARINLSYFKASGEEVVVFCPQVEGCIGNTEPARRRLNQADGQPTEAVEVQPAVQQHLPARTPAVSTPVSPWPGFHFGWAVTDRAQGTALHHPLWRCRVQLWSIIGPYLQVRVRRDRGPVHSLAAQIQNFVRFCEVVLGWNREDQPDHPATTTRPSWPTLQKA